MKAPPKRILYAFLTLLLFANTAKAAESNLVSSGTITASSYSANHDATLAADQDLSSYWEAATSNGVQWLETDLKDLYHLNKIVQVFAQSSVWKFKVEGSVDKENWVMLVDKTNGASGIVFGESVNGMFRYLRLTMLGSADNFKPSSKEFSVEGTKNRINIAAGKSFINTNRRKNYEPEKSVDNDISTYWCAEDGKYPKSITLDLGASQPISGVQQVFKDYDTWRFKIEGSDDQSQWSMILNKITGDSGFDFSADANGTFRYIRLTVLGSSSGFWSNSCEFNVYSSGSNTDENPLNQLHTSSSNTEWWKNTSGLIRYYCKLYKNQLSDITDSLDILQARGYQVIELMAPYKGSADIWAGLGATDNYDIDPSIGTLADFEELIREAHKRDIKIIFFGNVGYCRDEAPFFQKACEDERNKVDSKERKWFHFSNEKKNDQWFWSEKAQAYYFSFWGNTDGANGRIPSYNFNNREWQEECEKYLNFWADKGVDGLFLDAPEVYDGITDPIIQHSIVDVLNKRNIATNAEGSSDIYRWMGGFRFNCIQGFEMYGWGGGKRSEVLSALYTGNPSGLNDKLKGYRDQAAALNGVTLTPPMWEIPATNNERIFEAAYLATMGTLFASHCGDKEYVAQDIIATWPEKDQERFFNLMRTQNSYKGLAPSGQRTVIPTNNDNKFTAFKRSNSDGNVSTLVIANFQRTTQTITVNLKNCGIQLNQLPINLNDGTAAKPITGEVYTVTLPALGYAVLGVQNMLQVNIPTHIGEVNINKPGLVVYPNPFVNEITVASPGDIKVMKIYSLTGLLAKEFHNISTHHNVPLDELQPGTYILKTWDVEDRVYTNKITKY